MKQFYREFLGLHPGMRVVDVGCGTGEFTRQLARLVQGKCEIVGVDSRAVSLKAAELETRKARLSARIVYKKGDLSKLPVQDDFADLACCRSVLMHLTDPQSAVVEMARVIKPSGTVAAVEPGLMSSFYDPDDERFTELDRKMSVASRKGARKLTGKEFAIGERLPSIFREQGLQEISVEVLANAWTPCDARFRKNQVKAVVQFWDQLFRDGKKNERRFLLAAGVAPRTINRHLRLCDNWSSALLANVANLKNRTFVSGSSLFVVTGRKLPPTSVR